MQNKPDVRIRLSAEGVNEVVQALKQVQAAAGQTKKSVDAAGSGFGSTIKNVMALKTAVTALAATAGVGLGVQFVASFAQTADAAAKLSQQLGISVEDLTRLQYAARLSGIESDQLRDALKDLSKNLVEAANGGGRAVNALNAMGIAVRNSDGTLKTQTQVLREVADKFAGYEDGAAKSTLAMQLMGESGLVMIPLLNAGADGIARMTDESDRLGNTITTNTAKAAEQFNDNLARLQTATVGVARELAGPLIAALADVTTRLLDAMRAGEGFMGTLDAVLNGLGKRSTVAGAQSDMDELAQEYMRLEKLARQYSAANQAIPDDIQFAMGKVRAEYKEARANLAELTRTALASPAVDTVPAPVSEDGAAATKLSQAAAAAAQARNEAELRLLKVKHQLTEKADRASFEQGLLTLEQYHARRLSALQQSADAELAIAQQKLAAANAMPVSTPEEQLAKERATSSALIEIEQRRTEAALARLDAEQRKTSELRELETAQLELRRQILELTQQQGAAAEVALEIELRKMDELLAKQGVAADERARILQQARTAGENDMRGAEANSRAGEAFGQIDLERQNVDRGVAQGKYFQIEAEQKLKEAIEAQLPVLREQVEVLRMAGEAAAADALEQKLLDLSASTDTYGQSIATLKQTLQDSLASGANKFFDSIIDGSASAKDAFRTFAADVADSLRRIAQEMLIQQMFKTLFASFGGGGGGLGSLLGGLGGSVKAATGGYIEGPGTGTSDSIPAWLSNGEYVIRAAAVQSVGLDALNEINRRGRLPAVRSIPSVGSVKRYADGGLVGSLAPAGGGGDTSLTVGLDDGLVLKKLRTAEGKKLILEAIGEQRRAVRQLIG